MSFFEELKRRNVFRVGIAYAVATWLLIQVTDIVFPRIGLPDSAVTLVIALLAIGFIPALIFAWAFEMTPDGIKKEADVDRSKSITPSTGRNLNRMIIAVLALVIFSMAAERFWFAGQDEEAETLTQTESSTVADAAKSIAVLPFADMSQNGDQEWFADGLAEEILNALARAPDLLVSSRTSSFAYKGTNTPIGQIANELGVQHVLEGSVRRAGDRIRVTAQLIRANDGFHVWSENFDRDAADVIAIQEELAVSIAKALKTSMDPDALKKMLQAGTRSVAAYEHYLNGLSLESRANSSADWSLLNDAYQEFEQARSIDPGFSDAHSQAANFWLDNLSISRRGVAEESPSLDAMMALFRERNKLAIETANNPIDRARNEGQLAMADFRARDVIRLFSSVVEQRPNDFNSVDDLMTGAVWAADQQTLNAMLDHVLANWERGDDWAQQYVTFEWRIGGKPRDRDLFVQRVMEMVARFPSPGLAYQAHRALLWMGEVEKATSLLPLLANDEDGRPIIDVRQACAEGRRSDAERVLAGLDPDKMSTNDFATRSWHIRDLLNGKTDAEAYLKPYETVAAPMAIANYLVYPQFDPAAFPVLTSLMKREGIKRPATVKIPFTCPDEDLIQQESVAVLPFTAMSSGEDDGYFADGLTEEILNSLARLPELLVTARTSSFHFKGKDLPIPEIASTLGVDHIVEGSVRRSGNQVRITAQLIRAEDGFHLWSDTYDRTLEDIFAVQEDIAENIAGTLDVVLNEDKRQKMRDARIEDVEAFIAYQKGMEAFGKAHATSDPGAHLAEANLWFDRALEIVPDLTNALYLRTDMYGHILYNHAAGADMRSEAELQEARQETRISLDKAWQSADSETQRAMMDAERTLLSDDWSGLGAKLDKALRPGECTPINWVPSVGVPFGWVEQVAEYERNLLRCDPLRSLPAAMLTYWETWGGDPLKALKTSEHYLQIQGFHPWLDDARFTALLASGEYRNDPDVLDPQPEGSSFLVPREFYVHALNNDLVTAQNVLDTWQAENEVGDQTMMMTAAVLGNRELANQYAGKMDQRAGGILLLSESIKGCFCGAPFDLDATPNYKKRIEEAGFSWPPASAINYPAKDW